MSRPGLLWASGKISKPDTISPENFDKWYNEVHIPDLVKTKGISSAYRYKNADPNASPPYLAMYPLRDVKWSESEEFRQVPFKSDFFQTESHHALDCVDFDIRFYEEVQRYEGRGAKPGPAKIVISAALSPAVGTDADFDKWYREEHLFELSKCTGYARTRRYKLDSAIPEGKRPAYLAVHEFDDNGFDIAEVMKTTETPWASKTMGALTMNEILVFHLTYSAGDVDQEFLPLNV